MKLACCCCWIALVHRCLSSPGVERAKQAQRVNREFLLGILLLVLESLLLSLRQTLTLGLDATHTNTQRQQTNKHRGRR